MTTPLSKKNQKYASYYCTERALSNAGISKNYNLQKIQNIIKKAITDNIPDAYNIIVGRRYYYFESQQKPELGQIIAISRYISYRSGLHRKMRVYHSKRGNPSTRVLFKTVYKNYNF